MGSSCSVDGPVLKPKSKRKFLSKALGQANASSQDAIDPYDSAFQAPVPAVPVRPTPRPHHSEGDESSTYVHSVCASHSCGHGAQSISKIMPEQVLRECNAENADGVFLKFVCAHLQPMSTSATRPQRKGHSPAASSLTSAAASKNRTTGGREVFSTAHWATESHSLSSAPCDKVRLPRLSLVGNESAGNDNSAATLLEGDRSHPESNEINFLSEAEEEVHENPLGSL